MKPALFISGLALFLGACATPREISTSTAAQVNAEAAMGRPHGLSSGAHMAYWVWKDQDAVWHVRTTSERVRHHFEGIVHPLAGTTIVNLHVIGHERNDEIGLVGGDIDLKFMPKENVDGVDFQLTGPDSLEFDLKIDNDSDPTHIYIGEGQHRPANGHFIISP